MTITIALIVLVALSFDFFNGFHDAANSIATVVSTRVLTPRQAVAWAAFFNFAAFLIFGTKVANTISNVVHPGTLTNAGIFAALFENSSKNASVRCEILSLIYRSFRREVGPRRDARGSPRPRMRRTT